MLAMLTRVTSCMTIVDGLQGRLRRLYALGDNLSVHGAQGGCTRLWRLLVGLYDVDYFYAAAITPDNGIKTQNLLVGRQARDHITIDFILATPFKLKL